LIEAVYGFNDYLKDKIEYFDYDAGEFYPGRFAPIAETTARFVTYTVKPGDIYDLSGLQNDVIRYTLYNTSFDELHRIASICKDAINVDNIQNSEVSETGVRYMDAYCNMGPSEHGEYMNGSEYHYLPFTVTLMYTYDGVRPDSMEASVEGNDPSVST
jgi:hypothetical protein